MTKNSDFNARLARIQALRGESEPQINLKDDTPVALGTARRSRNGVGMISATVGLALMAGVIGWNWDSFVMLLPSERDGIQMSFLETAAYDSMTEEEISAMNSDPDLAGKSTMQKLLLSN